MKKILYYSEGWGLGGIERFIMNVTSQLDPIDYSFDIFCTHDWDSSYDSKIKEMGARRYTVFHNYKPNLLVRLIISSFEWYKLIKRNKYDIVHINTMNGVGFVYSFIAWILKVPIRIVHSHNSSFGTGNYFVKKTIHEFSKFMFGFSATIRLACSNVAGIYLFNKRKFVVIPNGIIEKDFVFTTEDRRQIRNELGLSENTILIGNVARLSEAKNPFFQVELLHELIKEGIEAHLLLVGEGELHRSVIGFSRQLNVENYVSMPGLTNNPSKYMSALDVFSVPSKFEGLPMSLVEAAANGLPCIVSDTCSVPEIDGAIFQKISLNSISDWASAVCSLKGCTNRLDGEIYVRSSKYSVKYTVKVLNSIYGM